ncbi:MAG: transglycosylase SLT domain-containing protein [Candidatus Aenigmatarchaeota archaeon]
MKKGQLDIAIHQKAFIFLGAMIISILVLIFLYQQIQPSIYTHHKARASLKAYTIAYYLSALSSVEEGSIDKDLNETCTIEIGKYSGLKVFWKTVKSLLFRNLMAHSNYYLKLTIYDEKGNKLAESDDVTFVGSIENCEKPGKCLETEKITYVKLIKEAGKPVKLAGFKTIEEGGFFVCKNPTTKELENYIDKYANKYNVEIPLVIAVISAESQIRHCTISGEVVRSSANAIGLMQILPETATYINKKYNLNLDINDPEQNIHLGVLVLKENLEFYKNYPEDQQRILAVANYNCSGIREATTKYCKEPEKRKNCWEQIKPYLGKGNEFCGTDETIPYAERVMRIYECYKDCFKDKKDLCYEFDTCKNRWNA